MASSVEICNLALVHLGQEPILTLDDTSKEARLCRRLYDPTLEALLRSYPWSFAIRRVLLAQEVEPPVFGFSYQYTLPSDCMRIVSLSVPDGMYSIEQNKVLTDEPEVELRYVYKPKSANDFDAQFVQVFALRLAKLMCQSLTADQDWYVKITQQEMQAIMLAQHTSAIESSPQTVIEGNWIPSRY